MKAPNAKLKNRVFWLLILCILAILTIALTQPYLVQRRFTKIVAAYEISVLKYPDSHLIYSEIKPTSKVSMATDYHFYTSHALDTVLAHMETKLPGFTHLQGSYVINEPTYRNRICADETGYAYIFQIIDKGSPCVELSLYPANDGGTAILICENWSSQGFPRWLKEL